MDKGGIPKPKLNEKFVAITRKYRLVIRLLHLAAILVSGLYGLILGLLIDAIINPGAISELINKNPTVESIVIGSVIGLLAGVAFHHLFVEWERNHIASVMKSYGLILAVINAGPGNLTEHLGIKPRKWMLGLDVFTGSNTLAGRLNQVVGLYPVYCDSKKVAPYSRQVNWIGKASIGCSIAYLVLIGLPMLYVVYGLLTGAVPEKQLDSFGAQYPFCLQIVFGLPIPAGMVLMIIFIARQSATRLALIDCLSDQMDY